MTGTIREKRNGNKKKQCGNRGRKAITTGTGVPPWPASSSSSSGVGAVHTTTRAGKRPA